ncbi:hypothetical protein Q9S36_08465 [Microbacterium sp. ARD31]|uniref:hypothetical protein n=1 Tax=Microbacterium sp. ARD31 TaxID=2962576 RepID=UPI00288293CE|nr:hypothetical protein [Microbacterium sp. ARD31]MDT0180241.1 hypothetical protein [Microbacterium sp. ARD31]
MHDDAPGVIAFLNARWRVDERRGELKGLFAVRSVHRAEGLRGERLPVFDHADGRCRRTVGDAQLCRLERAVDGDVDIGSGSNHFVVR